MQGRLLLLIAWSHPEAPCSLVTCCIILHGLLTSFDTGFSWVSRASNGFAFKKASGHSGRCLDCDHGICGTHSSDFKLGKRSKTARRVLQSRRSSEWLVRLGLSDLNSVILTLSRLLTRIQKPNWKFDPISSKSRGECRHHSQNLSWKCMRTSGEHTWRTSGHLQRGASATAEIKAPGIDTVAEAVAVDGVQGVAHESATKATYVSCHNTRYELVWLIMLICTYTHAHMKIYFTQTENHRPLKTSRPSTCRRPCKMIGKVI